MPPSTAEVERATWYLRSITLKPADADAALARAQELSDGVGDGDDFSSSVSQISAVLKGALARSSARDPAACRAALLDIAGYADEGTAAKNMSAVRQQAESVSAALEQFGPFIDEAAEGDDPCTIARQLLAAAAVLHTTTDAQRLCAETAGVSALLAAASASSSAVCRLAALRVVATMTRCACGADAAKAARWLGERVLEEPVPSLQDTYLCALWDAVQLQPQLLELDVPMHTSEEEGEGGTRQLVDVLLAFCGGDEHQRVLTVLGCCRWLADPTERGEELQLGERLMCAAARVASTKTADGADLRPIFSAFLERAAGSGSGTLQEELANSLVFLAVESIEAAHERGAGDWDFVWYELKQPAVADAVEMLREPLQPAMLALVGESIEGNLNLGNDAAAADGAKLADMIELFS